MKIWLITLSAFLVVAAGSVIGTNAFLSGAPTASADDDVTGLLSANGSGTEGAEHTIEPIDPNAITSADGIDPNECNWVHNITACDEGDPGAGSVTPTQGYLLPPVDGSTEDGVGYVVSPPLPIQDPNRLDAQCPDGATISITSLGEVSCEAPSPGNPGTDQDGSTVGSDADDEAPPIAIPLAE